MESPVASVIIACGLLFVMVGAGCYALASAYLVWKEARRD